MARDGREQKQNAPTSQCRPLPALAAHAAVPGHQRLIRAPRYGPAKGQCISGGFVLNRPTLVRPQSLPTLLYLGTGSGRAPILTEGYVSSRLILDTLDRAETYGGRDFKAKWLKL